MTDAKNEMSLPEGVSIDRCGCPFCGADLVVHDATPTIDGFCPSLCGRKHHYSRKIGVVINDRIHHWECPDCGGAWSR